MSRSIGRELPESLWSRLNGSNLPSCLGKAFLITTVDPNGFPHAALLSYGEVVAVDRSRLRMAMYEGSRSVTHLKTNGKLTVSLVEEGLAYYVKGRAAPIPAVPQYPRLARFEIRIEEILEDQTPEEEAGTRITGGITFQPPKGDAELLTSWEGVLSALRA